MYRRTDGQNMPKSKYQKNWMEFCKAEYLALCLNNIVGPSSSHTVWPNKSINHQIILSSTTKIILPWWWRLISQFTHLPLEYVIKCTPNPANILFKDKLRIFVIGWFKITVNKVLMNDYANLCLKMLSLVLAEEEDIW